MCPVQYLGHPTPPYPQPSCGGLGRCLWNWTPPLLPQGLDLQGEACTRKVALTYLVSEMLVPFIKLLEWK